MTHVGIRTLTAARWLSAAALVTTLSATLAGGTSATSDCGKKVSEVLSRNTPEFMLLPPFDPESEFNTFVTSDVRTHVDWSHIHHMLKELSNSRVTDMAQVTRKGNFFQDSGCVKSYMVEYRTFKYYSSSGNSRISKRESVSSSSQISPPLNPDLQTGYTITLPDDCNVYAIQIVAILARGTSADLPRSASRRFWPSGRRTTLERFSDGIVLTFPPSCSHMTDGWRMQTCKTNGDDCDIRTLESGESPLHISQLSPCTSYSLRLLSPDNDEGIDDSTISSDMLWSFESVKTLPRPDFDVKASHTWLRLRITQADCEPSALVDHWRITRCRHVPKKRPEKPIIDDEDEHYEASGNGDEEGEEYYYYEEPTLSADGSSSCINSQHDVSKKSVIELNDLTECTLYSLDITPTGSGGQTLQPGEQYGTIHSTLCREQEMPKEQEEDWFGEQNSAATEISGSRRNRQREKAGHADGSDGVPAADLVPYYLLLAAGTILFAVLALFGIWVGCFYLSGVATASASAAGVRMPDRKTCGVGKVGVDEDDVASEEASNLVEDGILTSSPNVALLAAKKK